MATPVLLHNGPEGQVTVVRSRRSRYRDHSGRRRLIRVVAFLVSLALVAFTGFVLQRDLRVDRTLSNRGLLASGQLDSTGCLLCRAVGVTFTTTDGVKVSTVITAIGPQGDRTIAVKYDPRHPATVHPAHGVREEEGIAGVVLLVSLVVLLRTLGLPRRRRNRRPSRRIRTKAGSGRDATGHVRVLGS